MSLPSGFTADNCMVIGYAAKMTSGTGYCKGWCTGSNVQNAYGCNCELDDDNTVFVGINTIDTLRGNISIKVMLMKTGNIS